MKNLILIILTLFVYHKTAKAQTINELQKDPNILWIGETYTYFPLAERSHKLSPKRESILRKVIYVEGAFDFRLLKNSVPSYENTSEYDLNLGHKLLRYPHLQKKMEYYDDRDLTKKLTLAEIQQVGTYVDSIETFDPETFDPVLNVVKVQRDFLRISTFLLKQVIYYDKKKALFHIIPVAVCPILETRYPFKPEEETLSGLPLCWIKVEVPTKKPDLKAATTTWATRFYREYSFKEIENKKGDQAAQVAIADLVAQIQATPDDIDLYYYGEGPTMLDKKDKKRLTSEIDTIVTFDPNTFEEIINIEYNPLKIEHITRFRSVQDWVLDENTGKLYIDPISFGLCIDGYNTGKKDSPEGVLFYQRKQ